MVGILVFIAAVGIKVMCQGWSLGQLLAAPRNLFFIAGVKDCCHVPHSTPPHPTPHPTPHTPHHPPATAHPQPTHSPPHPTLPHPTPRHPTAVPRPGARASAARAPGAGLGGPSAGGPQRRRRWGGGGGVGWGGGGFLGMNLGIGSEEAMEKGHSNSFPAENHTTFWAIHFDWVKADGTLLLFACPHLPGFVPSTSSLGFGIWEAVWMCFVRLPPVFLPAGAQ